MNGLLKNNYYAARSNIKGFSVVLLLMAIFVIAVDNNIPTLIIGYMLLGMIGFSVLGITSLRKEGVSKWGKYKLIAPVKRSDIVRSYFASQLIWLFCGIVFAATGIGLSVLLHGFPFDRNTDILMLFVMGIGISFFTDAIFFPLFYLGGDERTELFLIVSLLFAVIMFIGLISLINFLFGPEMTTLQIITGAAILLACSLLAFISAYPLTVRIFKQKEY